MIMGRLGARPGPGERGMVTAELAVATLAAGAMLIMLSWGIFLIGLQLRCIDSATEVARQAARHDNAAVTAARSRAPKGSAFQIRKSSELVTVEVRLGVRPFAFHSGAVPVHASGARAVVLSAQARVVPEPGA